MPSKHMIEFTSIEVRLKDFGVRLLATGPDDNEIPVQIDGLDIRQQFGMNPAAFVDAYADNEAVLYDLFRSVYGISYAD